MARSFVRLVVCSLPCVVLLGACADEAPAPAPPAPLVTTAITATDVPTYADFLSRDVALRCASLAPLCVRFGQTPLHSCDDVVADDTAPATSLGGTYSPEGAAACLEERKTRGGDAWTMDEAPGSPASAVASACDAVFRGPSFASVALGEACALDSDCAPLAGGRARCRGAAPGAGMCVGALAGKAGDRCNDKTSTGPQIVATADLVCDHANTRFVPAPRPGEACVEGQCGAGAVCIDQVCRAPLAEGAACGGPQLCASGRCASGVCAPLGRVGAACSAVTDCATAVCQDGACGRSWVYRDVCE